MPISRHSLTVFSALLLALVLCVLPQATPAQDGSAEAQTQDRAATTVEILQPLLELEETLRQQISDASAAGATADSEELQRLSAQLADVQDQISLVMSGVSEREFDALGEGVFDLNAEVQQLVEPFVLVLNEATNDARQLERTRRALDTAQRRQASAQMALNNIEAARDLAATPAMTTRIETALKAWQDRLDVQTAQIEALGQRISDLQSQRRSVSKNVNSAFKVFFRERGISLGLGVGSFVLVLAAARLIAYVMQRLMGWRGVEKTFAVRLAGILFTFFAVLAAFFAMLTIFNWRNDWLLLGLTGALLLATLWVVLRMLPNLLEQLSVLLNLGAVQERERVLFNGVPYKVERLSFFTDLVNPALDGGEFTLPVRELVGMHSRPAAQDETWFPSLKGDWVRLSDGNAGKVIAQTPELVVIELLGGSRITYQTADYLSATPENLSRGFRSEIVFGIGYQHLDIAADQVIEIMHRGVTRHFQALLDPASICRVDVEFLRAGASSLDYEVEIDVDGSNAEHFEMIERELARCMILIAKENDWEIPFQQVVLHTAPTS